MPKKKSSSINKYYFLGALILVAGFSLYSVTTFFSETRTDIKYYTSVLDGRRIVQNACPPHCPTPPPPPPPSGGSGSTKSGGSTSTEPTYKPVSKPVSTPVTTTKPEQPDEPKEYALPPQTTGQKEALKKGENPYATKRETQLDIDPVENREDAIRQVKKEIDQKIGESLEGKRSITIKDQDGDDQTIDRDTEIRVVFTFEEAKKELAKLEKNVKIIYPGVDSDQDNIDDITEAINGTNPFNPDTDDDGMTDGEELLDYASDPLTASEKDLTPGVVNLENHATGERPPIKGKGFPGIMVTLVAENIDTGEKIIVCEVIPDDSGKFFCQPEKRLTDGDYFLYSNHLPEEDKEDKRLIAKIAVGKYLLRHTPTFKVVETHKTKLIARINYVKVVLARWWGEEAVEKMMGAALELKFTKDEEKIQRIVGQTNPGEKVIVTIESFILSSAVISDASQGTFELPISKKLEIGSHRIYVYTFNPESRFVSNIARLIFSKI